MRAQLVLAVLRVPGFPAIIALVVVAWSASIFLRIVVVWLLVTRLSIAAICPWFGLFTFIIRGVPILLAFPISIVVQVDILTKVLVVSIFLVPRMVVFLANTIIVTIPLYGSISFVLAKSLVRLSTIVLWFYSPNQCRGLIQVVILAFIDFVCPGVANGAMYLHIAID